MSTSILVVEAEPRIPSLLARALSLAGYQSDEATSVDEALGKLNLESYDVVLLDLDLPSQNETEVMSAARSLSDDLIIIALDGNPTLEGAIAALKAEVADYLIKPISAQQIAVSVAEALQKRAARKERLVRQMGKAVSDLYKPNGAREPDPPMEPASPRSIVSSQQLTLNRSEQLVTFESYPERRVQLTKGETKVLSGLMTSPERVRSCQDLVRIAWGYELNHFEAASIIRPYISRLRQKLEPDPRRPRIIRTVRGQGYFLTNSVHLVS